MSITPATGSLSRSDLDSIYSITQNTLMSYPKSLIIGLIRDSYSKDSYYAYRSDQYGYPKVPDLTDVPLGAGYNDDTTTRIFIGEAFRFDAIFYPAILVRMTSAKSVPISISRNRDVVAYEKQLVIDGYGNTKEYFTPKYLEFAGAWNSTITCDILTRDILSRDDIAGFLMLFFTDIRFESLRKAGVLVQSGSPSLGGVSEGEDRQQDKLYKATVSVDIRTEWRRLIPVDGIIEQINLCVDFGVLGAQNVVDPNLQISTNITLLDQIDAL